jgi:aldehyde dehydrogenase (NAD+)
MATYEHDALFIGGEWHEATSGETREVINPHTEERIGHVALASEADVDRAVAAANAAFADWAATPVAERADLVDRLADELADRADGLATLITEETGSPILLSQLYSAIAPSVSFRYYADVGRNYPFEETRVSDLSEFSGGEAGGSVVPFAGKSLVVREPAGVVGVLTAWNVPLPLTAQKCGPALVAGCPVVIKTSDPNPLACYAVAEAAEAVGFPPGVINLIATEPEVSEYLVGHPGIDMVTFTGSTAVGRRIGEICGRLVRPCVLELGGKSAAIVLDDADLEQAVTGATVYSVGSNTGESCVCMSRILVPESRYDEFAEALEKSFESLPIGDPLDPQNAIGPLVTARHRERVEGFFRVAADEGATIATGGKRPEHLERGWYVEPTLFTDARNEMKICQEEIFGPATALLAYETEEEAVAIANDSSLGLSGTVWTADDERGFAVARRVRSGQFCVNTYAADLNSPFGGMKDSGIGREMGVEGFEEYLIPKTISIDPSASFPRSLASAEESVPVPA